jgi:predicted DNA-binding ribbon-helix-helix protein
MPRTIKRSVKIAGHNTSVSLEDAFWDALKDMANENTTSVAELIREMDQKRLLLDEDVGLSSAIRIFVLEHYRS